MTLPENVRKQGEESERIQQQLLGVPTIEAKEASSQSADPQATQESDPRKDDPSYWKQRFSVVQGKYNAEVPRLKKQIADLESNLHDLQKTPAPHISSEPEQPKQLLTEDEREEYGEFAELIDKVAGRIVEQNHPPVVDQTETRQLKNELESLKERTTQNDIAEFFKDIEQSIPNWETVNDDPKFHQWLQQIDLFSGRNYQSLLEEAQGNLDSIRAIAFFETYLNSVNPERSKPTRQDFVQPKRVQGEPFTLNEPQVWTRQAIHQFYDDIRRGTYQGREDEKRKIETDIHLAYTQGRIR